AGFVRARTLIKYSLASNFHPFRQLSAKLAETKAAALLKWKQGLDEANKQGVDASTVDASGAKEEQPPDKNGKQPPPKDLNEPNEKLTPEGVKGILSDPKGAALKGGGVLALLVGIICLMKTIADHIGEIRFVQVIGPMARMATQTIAAGQQ